MRSVKRGRGPSFMGGAASVLIGVVGIAWTIAAGEMGAPGFFRLFGIVFVLLAVGNGIYELRNAVAKNRHSEFDITDENEEPDPLNQRFGAAQPGERPSREREARFCSQCGARLPEDAKFCPGCGRSVEQDRQ